MIKKSKVTKLSELVDYQDGSVVSKTIIDKKVGTVTVFAFDKDQCLNEHTVPFDALVYVFDGKAEIVIADESYVLKKDDLIIMPKNSPHEVYALEKFKMVLTMIRK